MPYQTDNFIHLPNPDHPEGDFRKNNKGGMNIVGTTNFGNGIKARLGLLLGTGKSAVAVYLFQKPKYTMETARAWLDNHKSKGMEIMGNSGLLNKNFNFILPVQKTISSAESEDGYMHVDIGLSTMVPDLQEDELTKNCLDDMITQIKGMKLTMNDGHNHKLKDLIGPTTDAWIEGTDLMVDLRVRKEWEPTITDLMDSGTLLGGSIEGRTIKTIIDDGKEKIDMVKLFAGGVTDIPAAWNLRGSARKSKEPCTNSICHQIIKSVSLHNKKNKLFWEDDMTNIEKIELLTDELFGLTKAITVLPGWQEDLDSEVTNDKANLMSLMGAVVTAVADLIEDMIDEEMQETPEQEAAEEKAEAE